MPRLNGFIITSSSTLTDTPMDILIGLISVSLGMAGMFLVVFLWNLKNGQYDDTVTPAIRILFDTNSPADDPKTDEECPADEDQTPG